MVRLGRRFPVASTNTWQGSLPGDPYFNNVVALLHCDGTNASTTFIDSSPLAANFTNVASASLSTSQAKFGSASLFMGVNSQVGAAAASSNFAFGTGDFTIEYWAYSNSSVATQIVYDQRPTSTQGLYPVIYQNSGPLTYYVNSTNQINGSTLSISTWHHVAVSRVSGNTRMFIDGAQSGSTYVDSNNYLNATGRPYFGEAFGAGVGFNGFIDEARITKGVGRYSANFTAPTAPFPNYPLR